MLSPFIDSSVDNVLLQTSTIHLLSSSAFLYKQRPIDSLLHDTANIVSERTEVRAVGGHRFREMKFIDVCLSFQPIFRFCILQVVQKQTLGGLGNLNGHLVASYVLNACTKNY